MESQSFSMTVISQEEPSPPQSKVRVIKIEGMIDFGLAAFVDRMVKKATAEGVDAVLLDIDTAGGRVDAALKICRSVEEAEPLATMAYTTDRAWSAGALIALSTKSIVMAPGSSIGSALPVAIGAGEAPENLVTAHSALGFWSESQSQTEAAKRHYKEALGSYLENWLEYELARERLRRLRNEE